MELIMFDFSFKCSIFIFACTRKQRCFENFMAIFREGNLGLREFLISDLLILLVWQNKCLPAFDMSVLNNKIKVKNSTSTNIRKTMHVIIVVNIWEKTLLSRLGSYPSCLISFGKFVKYDGRKLKYELLNAFIFIIFPCIQIAEFIIN